MDKRKDRTVQQEDALSFTIQTTSYTLFWQNPPQMYFWYTHSHIIQNAVKALLFLLSVLAATDEIQLTER